MEIASAIAATILCRNEAKIAGVGVMKARGLRFEHAWTSVAFKRCNSARRRRRMAIAHPGASQLEGLAVSGQLEVAAPDLASGLCRANGAFPIDGAGARLRVE